MRTVGVICEYNPFHHGHLTQFRQIRTLFGEDAAIICLMSGNFVQRGECAVFDKLVRASAAVDCGASLVLELPVTGALRSAEGFARCGVEILDALGVEMLAFGSESGETENFLRLGGGDGHGGIQRRTARPRWPAGRATPPREKPPQKVCIYRANS